MAEALSHPYLLEFGNASLLENLFYCAMDRLLHRQDLLERLIYEQVVSPLTSEPALLYHDLTSTYCEGEVNDFVRFGHNRDQVTGCPQVNWGMVVTPEGFPITLQVYPGNTTDVTTVVGMRERLERVFRLHQGIYVGDRGMMSEDVEKDLTEHRFQWILAEKNDDIEEILEAGSRTPVLAVSDWNEIREHVDPNGVRHILLLNEERRKEILGVLKIRQAQGRAIIEAVRRGWAKKPDRAPHAVLRQAIVATVVKRLETHGRYLWAEVPGRSVVIRSTVLLERDHGADRRAVRHRTGRENTGEEIGRLGSLLPFWANMKCPWFRDHVLPGVNLWEVFVGQDAEEVQRRVGALPREGRRPRVLLPRGEKARECLENLVKLVTGKDPLEPRLSEWMASVSPPSIEIRGV